MNKKTLVTLEYNKIIDHLISFSDFSTSAELAQSLLPTNDLAEARSRQVATREARLLLDLDDSISFNGAVDLKPLVSLAQHDGVLEPINLLSIKQTLIISRSARRVFDEHSEMVPGLSALAEGLSEGLGLIDSISRAISDRGEVLDSASDALGRIRSELKITYERLISRLQKYLSDPSTVHMLQDTLITQRSDRYVLPLRSEFKGRIKAIIHDQSASGATLFIEPLPVVEWNNRYKELQLAERDEIRRILHELSYRVAENSEALIETTNSMASLDLAFMCAKYAEALNACEPELVAFNPNVESPHPGSLIQLLQARHPLLDPQKVVPIDVELDKQTYILVITGPNTGGKTVTLKTVGLLSLMAQAGMQIPAMSGSRLSIFEDIFADIGDEQSIEQSLSTFSGHITQLVYILEHANPHCLVLLDELGAGTDPQEGSALAMAVLSHLLESRITSFVATHYPELKAYAHVKEGVVNASVEFNLETLQPTYHLTIGLPGRSNALAIAERLGLPREIIQAAKAEINPTDLRAEDLLDEIHRQRDLTREARMKAETLRKEAEIAHNEVVSRLEKIEDERFLILEKTRQQAQEEIEKLREELDALRHELVKARQPLDIIEQVEEIIEEQEVEVGQPIVRKTQAPKRKQSTGPLRLGERVIVTSLNQEGVITAITENDVEVQMGMLRLRARKTEIKRKIFDKVIEEQEDEIKITGKTSIPVVESPGVELDIRGQRVEEALDLLQRYLERAYLAGLPYVRIIHGKGTGKLRQVVRETLGASGHISRWETGNESEGGDGVTVAFVKK